MKRTPERITIEVTQADIDRARRQDSYRCVVVQAIARTLPNAHGITVDTQTIRFTIDGERRQYLTPAGAAMYVVAFDAGDKLEPFRFRITSPRLVAQTVRTPRGHEIHAANQRARNASVGHSSEGSTPLQSDAGERTRRGGSKPTRLVFGSNGRRSYGQRVLRYNRDRGEGFHVDEQGEMATEEA